MTSRPLLKEVWNEDTYCLICGAGFTRVLDFEFHQSAHDAKFMISKLDRLAELTDEHQGEINWHEGQNITTKQLAVMKRKIETLPITRNVDTANLNHSSEKRRRGERAGSPRDDDRLFVTPDPEDPHRYTYPQQEVIESAKDIRQNHGTNESIKETTQEQSSNVQKTLNMAQLLALPAGPIVATIAYPEGVFRKATYQCLHPEWDNKKGQGNASEVSRAKHWRRAHERGYSQYPGGMRGLQPFTVL
ncbi:hypothetical protein D6C97_08791 [Aureobasidium pullulans]|nr:hypothetical protein D6D11_02738 [Aureobasidium pullulans]THY44896.1 hypothetical protein D6C97_08791 [Aureobasidium pullulans]